MKTEEKMGKKEKKKKDKSEMPEIYTPSKLIPIDKQRREVTYAVGYQTSVVELPDSYTDGPHPDLKTMLEVVPEIKQGFQNPIIVRFNSNFTEEVLYRWDKDKMFWKLIILK